MEIIGASSSSGVRNLLEEVADVIEDTERVGVGGDAMLEGGAGTGQSAAGITSEVWITKSLVRKTYRMSKDSPGKRPAVLLAA